MHTKYPSMLIILAIYVLATLVGIVVFRIFSEWSLIPRLLAGNIAATFVIYFFSLILDNASVYDPYWSVQPPLILVLCLIHLNIALTFPIFLLMISIMVWAVRLTFNWARGWEGFHDQDWRYTMLKEKAPKMYPLTNLFGIQLMPTLLVFLQLIGPIRFMQGISEVNFLLLIGTMMILLSAVFQYIADEQMKQFKDQNKVKKACIDQGLWSVSRHPNYFGEIMVWWGVFLIYFSQTMRFDILILAPIAMTGLFVFISIPMMEKKMLRTRPEYQIYQKQVSMLIPWFRKTKDRDISIETI